MPLFAGGRHFCLILPDRSSIGQRFGRRTCQKMLAMLDRDRFSQHSLKDLEDGGRLKWEKEGRPLTRVVPPVAATDYPAVPRNDRRIRAFRDDVLQHIRDKKPLVDVRSPEEYRGERLHMEGYPNEGALRGGHIPGALGIPWGRAVNPETGTFKSADELRSIYIEKNRLKRDDDVIVYCRIGERSSHT